MVRIRLSLRQTLDEAAAVHFEAAKKARRKVIGAKKTVETAKALAEKTQASRPVPLAKGPGEWYEKFRWTKTLSGLLIVAGKDAASNELLIKKHAEPTDTVIHTELAGSPFALIKGNPTKQDKELACQFVAAYSSAWKRGLATADVYCVKPDQVTKTAQAGEFISKGSFMVRGARENFSVPVSISVGILEGRAVCGVEAFFTQINAPHATLSPGKLKASDVAKQIGKRLGGVPDDWLPLLPAGTTDILAMRRGTTNKKAEP